jgi:hypothetical protein
MKNKISKKKKKKKLWGERNNNQNCTMKKMGEKSVDPGKNIRPNTTHEKEIERKKNKQNKQNTKVCDKKKNRSGPRRDDAHTSTSKLYSIFFYYFGYSNSINFLLFADVLNSFPSKFDN